MIVIFLVINLCDGFPPPKKTKTSTHSKHVQVGKYFGFVEPSVNIRQSV